MGCNAKRAFVSSVWEAVSAVCSSDSLLSPRPGPSWQWDFMRRVDKGASLRLRDLWRGIGWLCDFFLISTGDEELCVRAALAAATPLLDAGLRCSDAVVSNTTVSCWSSAFAPLPLTADDYPHCLVPTLHRVMRQTALVAPGLPPLPPHASIEGQAEAEEAEEQQGKAARRGSGTPRGGGRTLRPRKQSSSASSSQSVFGGGHGECLTFALKGESRSITRQRRLPKLTKHVSFLAP